MTIIINGTNTPTAGTVGIGNGTDLAFTAQGTVGQVLTSNGTSAPTWANAPTGAQAFALQSTGETTLLNASPNTGLGII